MEFKEMKERIKLVDVLRHYRITLRRKMGDDYASAACPLPTHPKEDRNNSAFGVHLPTNRWQCKHPTCGRSNGVGNKWGDCINLIMTLDKLNARAAAEKLDAWFPKENPASSYRESPEDGRGKQPPPHHTPEPTSANGDVKYTDKVRAWFDTIWPRRENETDDEYKARLLKAITSELIQNYKAGKAGKLL